MFAQVNLSALTASPQMSAEWLPCEVIMESKSVPGNYYIQTSYGPPLWVSRRLLRNFTNSEVSK